MYQWIATALIGIVATGAFAFTANSVSSVKDISKNNTATGERVARLEEAVITLKTDNAEIKSDLKVILRAVKK